MFTRITKFFVKQSSSQPKQRGRWTAPSVSEDFYLVSRASMSAELKSVENTEHPLQGPHPTD